AAMDRLPELVRQSLGNDRNAIIVVRTLAATGQRQTGNQRQSQTSSPWHVSALRQDPPWFTFRSRVMLAARRVKKRQTTGHAAARPPGCWLRDYWENACKPTYNPASRPL